MNNRVLLLLVGLLVVCAVITAAREHSEKEVSAEESRVARDADPRRTTRKKKRSNNCTKKCKKFQDSTAKKKCAKKCSTKGSKKRTVKRRNGKKKKCRNPPCKRGSRKDGPSSRQSVDAACVSAAAITIRRWKEKAVNFGRQYKQMTKQQDLGKNKANKKGGFKSIVNKLVGVGGGNKSALTCSGQADSTGAKQMKNLTDLMEGCEKAINDSCNLDNFPKPNMTELDACKAKVDEFSNATTACFADIKNEATAAKGCQCFVGAEIKALLEAVDNCSAESAFTGAKEQAKNCKKAFSDCKKYQDDAVDTLSACSADVSKLTEKAAALNKNAEAVKKAKAKVKELTGSKRIKRAVATTCTEVITKVKALVTVVQQSPAATIVYTYAVEISESTVTCSDADKALLAAEEASLDEALTEIEDALEDAQDDLMAATGSTASAEALSNAAATTAASMGTTKSARLRRRFRSQFNLI